MAQTGFTPLLIYSSSTATNAPTAGDLLNNATGSELAINIADGKLFYKDSANAVQVIAWKTTPTTAGGTGLINYTAGDLPYYASGVAFTKLGIGTSGYFLTSSGTAPQWTNPTTIAVTSISFGTTGLTPSTATKGDVTVAGTLVVGNGGTGLASLTAGYIPYGNGTSAFGSSANMTFNGTTFTLANDAVINSLTIGKGASATTYNTAFGVSALASNTSSGEENTAVGYQTLKANTSGTSNSAFGVNTLVANTTGNSNSGFGENALATNTTGGSNTAVGNSALAFSTTASNNTAVGYQSVYSNSTGSGITAIGFQALYSNTGNGNTAVGGQVLYSNTSGGANNGFGASDSFIGSALQSNTTGGFNNAFGNGALASNTTGGTNSAFGHQALNKNTTASNNTAVGYQAGYGITTGASNTYIGYAATQSGVAVTNEIVVGASLTGKGSNTAFIGGTSGAYNGANSAAWSITSDARIKKNVVSLETGLDVISALRPVEFDYIENDKHDIGFIAQEYQTVLPSQISEGADGMLSLNQNLVPYLVKAIQELKAEIDLLKGK